MPDLTAANLSRLNAALDKKYRFSHGVDTYRGMIEAGYFSHAEEGQVSSVQWNRRKFNRMDQRQQDEYQRKLDTMKPEYRLFNKDCEHGSYVAVPKMVFEFYQNNMKGS